MKTNNIKIRDRRNKGWFYLDNEYLNGLGKYFGPIGISVYVSLCRHANLQEQCYPSQDLIGKEIGVNRITVSKYIKLLEKHNVINITKQKSKNNTFSNTLYTLLDKTVWIYPNHVNQIDMVSHVNLTTEPCQSDDISHVNQIDTKNTNTTNNTKEKKTQKSISYLENLSSDVKLEFSEKYNCTQDEVSLKAEMLVNWCKSKNKWYADYRSALQNWLLRDYGKRKENYLAHKK
ncbi:MAG: Helix-turn-helix domain [Bacteroidota bacterium]|jgi:predicted transcriptional regulator